MLYIILGIIQGLTEFLPVSSSGHLVLFSWISGIEREQILPITIACHVGTLFAIFCFFAQDIFKMFKDLVLISLIFIVTVITGVFVLINKSFLEQLFQKPTFVCVALFATAILLILTRRFAKGRRNMFALNIKDAFWLGICQGLAVIPGISRSGITIFSLLARRVQPEVAFRFSFIAGIPAIIGSFILEAEKIGFAYCNNPINFWLVFGASFISGLLGLFILKRVVKGLKLHYFGYYLVVIATLGFMFTSFHK
jgi:undecaprenyl-diphosphatase